MHMKVKNRPSEPTTTETRKDQEGAFRVPWVFYARIVQKKCSASCPCNLKVPSSHLKCCKETAIYPKYVAIQSPFLNDQWRMFPFTFCTSVVKTVFYTDGTARPSWPRAIAQQPRRSGGCSAEEHRTGFWPERVYTYVKSHQATHLRYKSYTIMKYIKVFK